MKQLNELQKHALKVCVPISILIFLISALLTSNLTIFAETITTAKEAALWAANSLKDTIAIAVVALIVSCTALSLGGLLINKADLKTTNLPSLLAIFYMLTLAILMYSQQNPDTLPTEQAFAITITLSLLLTIAFTSALTNNGLGRSTIRNVAIATPALFLSYLSIIEMNEVHNLILTLNPQVVTDTLQTKFPVTTKMITEAAYASIALPSMLAFAYILTLLIQTSGDPLHSKNKHQKSAVTLIAHVAMYIPVLAYMLILALLPRVTKSVFTLGAGSEASLFTQELLYAIYGNIILCAFAAVWLCVACITRHADKLKKQPNTTPYGR